MKRITKCLIFLLLFAALAGHFFHLNLWESLKDSVESGDRSNLRHWLSIQSRLEDLEDEVAVFWDRVTDPRETQEGTEPVNDPHSERPNEEITEAEAVTTAITETVTIAITEAVTETVTTSATDTETEAITEASGE